MPIASPSVHCHRTVRRNHDLNASKKLVLFNHIKPMYRNGKDTPSLHADSADSRCLSLLGTRSLNVDSASTDAANTGSVGARQAPMIKAAGTLV